MHSGRWGKLEGNVEGAEMRIRVWLPAETLAAKMEASGETKNSKKQRYPVEKFWDSNRKYNKLPATFLNFFALYISVL